MTKLSIRRIWTMYKRQGRQIKVIRWSALRNLLKKPAYASVLRDAK